MAQVLASLYAMSSEPLSLEYGRHADTVGLYCRIRGPLAKILEKQLAAAYPDLTIERLDESAIHPPANTQHVELWLAGDVLPIDTCDAFEDRISRELNDPLASLLGVLAGDPAAGVWSHVAIEITPASRRRDAAWGPSFRVESGRVSTLVEWSSGSIWILRSIPTGGAGGC